MVKDFKVRIKSMNTQNVTQTAIFAGGCFWGMEDLFRKVPGVISTTVGYTGGHTGSPVYEEVKTGNTGHAEAIEIIFQPDVVNYADLVTYFFKLHDPTTTNRQGNDIGSQYRSAIFYADEEQKKIATKVKNLVDSSGKWQKPIVTEITLASEFYPAEPEHQDYLERYPQGYTCHFVRNIEF
jgi:methionine-S-sulfoxide reductase